MGRLARLRRLRGPKSRCERFLTWRKGPLSTECLAYFLIVVLVYVNVQMILAIYAEKNYIEKEESKFHIKLNKNPIAEHEEQIRNGENPNSQENNGGSPKKDVGTSGDKIIDTLCPMDATCPAGHVHVYAESGPRRTKVCLNGKDVLPAWKTGRGINIVVINPQRGTAGSTYTFDTYQNPGTDMIDIIKEMNDGRLVVMTTQDEASAHLGKEARLSIEKLGSTLIHTLAWRSTWAFVGQVGTSSISEFEVIRHPLDRSSWPDAIALSRCIPHQLDNPALLHDLHTEFCERYDNYGSFCKGSWVRPQASPTLSQNPVSPANTYPIAIVAGNRGSYLRQVLASLFTAPGINPDLIVVFQDGYGEETFEVARQFGIRLVRFPRTDSAAHKEDTFNQADHIASNYKRSLDTIWEMYSNQEYVYILEDDLIVSPDFFSYYNQLLPVLAADPSIFTASCWNDNGYRHSSEDPALIYRTEFFPGLGWVLSRRMWQEVLKPSWPECCNGHSWDLYLRMVLQNRGMDCLYPDVSRTFHIGKTGANVFDEFFNGYFREKVSNKESYVRLSDLDKLDAKSYDKMIDDLVGSAELVDHTADPCDNHFIPAGDKTLVLYYYQRNARETRQAVALVGCLRLWNVDKVRGMFNQVLRTSYRGNRLLVVGSMSKYAKAHMPEGVVPFRIAKYKDELAENEKVEK